MVDLGIGFKDNINSIKNFNFTAQEAIGWAVDEKNTTKLGRIPGGLGLKLLREFIEFNTGKMLIVSDNGYWEQKTDEITRGDLAFPFPGSIVNLEFNTADTKEYYLAEETNIDEVF